MIPIAASEVAAASSRPAAEPDQARNDDRAAADSEQSPVETGEETNENDRAPSYPRIARPNSGEPGGPVAPARRWKRAQLLASCAADPTRAAPPARRGWNAGADRAPGPSSARSRRDPVAPARAGRPLRAGRLCQRPRERGGAADRRSRGARLRRHARPRAGPRGRGLARADRALRRHASTGRPSGARTRASRSPSTTGSRPSPRKSRQRSSGSPRQAEEVGLHTRFGRMMLEILPPVDADKGTAIRALLDERGLTRALYAGDDATDLDAFRALDGLELAICVALSSSEAPRRPDRGGRHRGGRARRAGRAATRSLDPPARSRSPAR